MCAPSVTLSHRQKYYLLSSHTKSGDNLKITFTSSEISDWLDALESHFCTDSEEAIKQYNMITKKLKNAEIRSIASKGKIRAIYRAEEKKMIEERSKIQEDILKQYSQSRR